MNDHDPGDEDDGAWRALAGAASVSQFVDVTIEQLRALLAVPSPVGNYRLTPIGGPSR